MKDAIGQEIQVGDLLFYGQSTARYQAFGVVQVLGFTATRAKVQWVKSDRGTWNELQDQPFFMQAFTHCVVITKLCGPSEV